MNRIQENRTLQDTILKSKMLKEDGIKSVKIRPVTEAVRDNSGERNLSIGRTQRVIMIIIIITQVLETEYLT